MARLSISLLGTFEVTLDGKPVTGFASDKVRALLAYLASEPDRPHRRETLAGLLWTDYPEASARTSLRRALADLRRVIGDHDADPPFLSISRQSLQFNCSSDAWCDVSAVERALVAPGLHAPTLDQLAQAVELYRGELLAGFSLGDSVLFDEWLLLKRERLRRQMLDALQQLTGACEACGDLDRALAYAWRQVELEPWQEGARRQLMRLLAATGQRGLAVAQYEALRCTLSEALRVEPAAETTRLYEQISAGEVRGQPPATQPPAAPYETAGPRARRHLFHKPLAVAGAALLFGLIGGALVLGLRIRTGSTTGQRVAATGSTPAAGRQIVRSCAPMAPDDLCVVEASTRLPVRTIDGLGLGVIESQGWSPDGQHVVFSAGPEYGDGQRPDNDLYAVTLDGGRVWRLTQGHENDVQPAWSPDGAWIAYHREGNLWIIRPDGTQARRLWEGGAGRALRPAWSPDSRRLAFVVELVQEERWEVWTFDLDRGAAEHLRAFSAPVGEEGLAWDPEGRTLAFHLVYRDQLDAIWLAADGTGEPQHMDAIPECWFATCWPQWLEAE
jgi:DNA-binding SARP family transcriptional activator